MTWDRAGRGQSTEQGTSKDKADVKAETVPLHRRGSVARPLHAHSFTDLLARSMNSHLESMSQYTALPHQFKLLRCS